MTHNDAAAIVLEHLAWCRSQGMGITDCARAIGRESDAPRTWDDVFALYAEARLAMSNERVAA